MTTDPATTERDRMDLSAMYRESRERLHDLVRELGDDAKGVPVQACPGWSVHDVVAHLVAIAEDVLAGRLTGPPTDEQTEAQVARRREKSTAASLDEWASLAPGLEDIIGAARVWPAALDMLSHEHDVRTAIERPGARDVAGIAAGADYLVHSLRVPTPVTVHVGERTYDRRPKDTPGGTPPIVLETDSFEAFRFRLGRRSRNQLEAMRWTGDPTPVLDHLCVFGPSLVDIIE